MRASSLLALVLMAALPQGCGASNDDKTNTSAKPKTFEAFGTIRVDDLGSIRYRRTIDHCVATGHLGEVLAIGKEPVLIKDPTGRQVALGKITDSTYDTYEDKGETYVAPGICTFTFSAPKIKKVDGIYTAEVDELGISAPFRAGTQQIELKYKPHG